MITKTKFSLVGLCILLWLAAAPASAMECPSGLERATEYRMFFGLLQKDGKVVTEEEWRRFLADTITPRFRDGLTVFDANGQWLAPSGTVVREPAKVVLAVAWTDPAKGMKFVEEISVAYAKRFNQSAVFRVVGPFCAG